MTDRITPKGSYASPAAMASAKRAREKALLALGHDVAKALCPAETMNCIGATFNKDTKEYEFLVESLPEIPTQGTTRHLFTGDANAILNALYEIKQAG